MPRSDGGGGGSGSRSNVQFLEELVITARKRSCRKVMFLHLAVSHSVHGGTQILPREYLGGGGSPQRNDNTERLEYYKAPLTPRKFVKGGIKLDTQRRQN